MKNSRRSLKIHFPSLALLALTGALIFLTLRVPPSNLYLIGGYIILIGFFFFYLSSYFLEKKFSLLVALTIVIALTMNYLIGFQIINILLLFSIVIGISYLIK